MRPQPPRSPRPSRALVRRLGAVSAVLALTLLAGLAVTLRSEPGNRPASEAVRHALESGDYVEAGSLLRRWLKESQEDPEANFLAARAHLGLNDPQSALKALELARAFGYPEGPITRLRGLVLAKVGRFAEAEPALRRALAEAEGPDPEVGQALSRVYLETYRLAAAEAVIDRWMRDAPDDPKPYLWRTEISRRSDGDPALLIRDYTEALRRDPDLEEARLGLAEALREDHRYAEAEAAYDAHLARKPDDPAALLGRARTALEAGDEATALPLLDRVLALSPADPAALIERAAVDFRRGDAASALGRLDRAARLAPDDPEIRYRRSLALARLGRTDEARAEQEVVTRLRSDAQQLKEIREGLLRTPDDRHLQGEAARWLIEHGHGEEGLRWAQQVLRVRPGDPEMNRLLADYYEGLGNPGLANFHRAAATPDPGAKAPAKPPG